MNWGDPLSEKNMAGRGLPRKKKTNVASEGARDLEGEKEPASGKGEQVVGLGARQRERRGRTSPEKTTRALDYQIE